MSREVETLKRLGAANRIKAAGKDLFDALVLAEGRLAYLQQVHGHNDPATVNVIRQANAAIKKAIDG